MTANVGTCDRNAGAVEQQLEVEAESRENSLHLCGWFLRREETKQRVGSRQ